MGSFSSSAGLLRRIGESRGPTLRPVGAFALSIGHAGLDARGQGAATAHPGIKEPGLRRALVVWPTGPKNGRFGFTAPRS